MKSSGAWRVEIAKATWGCYSVLKAPSAALSFNPNPKGVTMVDKDKGKITIEAGDLDRLSRGLLVVGYVSGVKIEARPPTEALKAHDLVVFKVSSPSLVQGDPVKRYERLKNLVNHRVALVLIPCQAAFPFPGELE